MFRTNPLSTLIARLSEYDVLEAKRRVSEDSSLQWGLLSIILSVIAYLVVFSPIPLENTSKIFSTLAAAQATILAIVFSVTVVAVQLVTDRYSPRLVSLFVEDKTFRGTFWVFMTSIAVDVLGLTLQHIFPLWFATAFALFGISLAGIAMISLFNTIRTMLSRSTPEHLIDAIVGQQLNPYSYLSSAAGILNPHPFHPLYSMIVRAIEDREYDTAEYGIAGMETALIDALGYCRRKSESESEEEFHAEVFERPLEEYVETISVRAFENEQVGLVSDVTSTSSRIARNAVLQGDDKVAVSAVEGLAEAFNVAPLDWDGHKLRDPINETYSHILILVAEVGSPAAFRRILINYSSKIKIWLRRQPDSHVPDFVLVDYVNRDYKQILEVLLERYADKVNEPLEDWRQPHPQREQVISDEAMLLRRFWSTKVDVTESIVRYGASNEDYPIDKRTMLSGWMNNAEMAARAGLPGLASLYCQSAIELQYCFLIDDEDSSRLIANDLARLRLTIDVNVVDNAFEYIQKQGPNYMRRIRPSSLNTVPKDDSSGVLDFLKNNLGETEEQSAYVRWISELKVEVVEREETLKER